MHHVMTSRVRRHTSKSTSGQETHWLVELSLPSLSLVLFPLLDVPENLERVAQEDFIKGKQQWENGRENGGAIDVLALAVVLEHNR